MLGFAPLGTRAFGELPTVGVAPVVPFGPSYSGGGILVDRRFRTDEEPRKKRSRLFWAAVALILEENEV
jgi:hypothetical protein